LSDFDSVSSTNGVIHDTENSIYSQYKYSDNTPTVTNFIETKFKATDYLRNLIKSLKLSFTSLINFFNYYWTLNIIKLNNFYILHL